MNNLRPIYWHQGLFLQPQHFQLSQAHHQYSTAPLFGFINPFLWGVSRLKLDQAALAEGALSVEEGEFVFPGGEYVKAPGNAMIQPRTIDDELIEKGRPFNVYLGLRKWDENAANVTVTPNMEDVSRINTRFVTTADPEEVTDLYGEGPVAQVKRMSYVLKLFWENERDQLSRYDLITVARVQPELEEVKLAEDFIPPSIHADSSFELLGTIKDVYDKVAARCRRLEEYKTPRGSQGESLEPGVFFLTLGLRTISRYLFPLGQLLEARAVHPYAVYGLLAQFAGELTTFSKSVSATGEPMDGKTRIPGYDHHDLFGCFNQMHEVIGKLLDEITFGPEAVIRLEKEEEYYVGAVENRLFDENNLFYLAVNTQASKDEVQTAMKTEAKLSARENLEILVSRSLPGLALEFVPVPPPGLPQISSTSYFRVDTTGSQWNDVRRMGNLALYWDTAPEDMVAEVIVIRRS